jgi:hypothetical protein
LNYLGIIEMDLLKQLIGISDKKATSIVNQITEGKDYFPEVDVIKLDPDRVDVQDITQALLPTLIRIAYAHLAQDKAKYERTHTDEDDDPFEFTESELEDRLDMLVRSLRDSIGDLTGSDYKSAIDSVKKEFKEKLSDSE